MGSFGYRVILARLVVTIVKDNFMYKNTNILSSLRKLLVMVLATTLVISCGDAGETDTLPTDAIVDISPNGKEWLIDGDPPPPCVGIWHDSYHTVSVKNGLNQTLLAVPVSLSIDLSATNFTGTTVLELFVDENRNNIPEVGELVSDNLSGAYDTVTSDVDGSLKVIVRMDVSCLYGGALTVQAASISGSAPFEVNPG